MITFGNFFLYLEYNMSPKCTVSADKKLIINKVLHGKGVIGLQIPNYTKETSIYITEKLDQHTITKDNQIVDDQFVKIIGAEHQGIKFNAIQFRHYVKPYLIHDNQEMLGQYLGFNFPSKLTFENIPLYDLLIRNTISEH